MAAHAAIRQCVFPGCLPSEAQVAGKSYTPPYSAIVIDETQDLGPQALTLLRAMIPAGENDLFLATGTNASTAVTEPL